METNMENKKITENKQYVKNVNNEKDVIIGNEGSIESSVAHRR